MQYKHKGMLKRQRKQQNKELEEHSVSILKDMGIMEVVHWEKGSEATELSHQSLMADVSKSDFISITSKHVLGSDFHMEKVRLITRTILTSEYQITRYTTPQSVINCYFIVRPQPVLQSQTPSNQFLNLVKPFASCEPANEPWVETCNFNRLQIYLRIRHHVNRNEHGRLAAQSFYHFSSALITGFESFQKCKIKFYAMFYVVIQLFDEIHVLSNYLIYIYEENIFGNVELSVFSLDLFIHDAQNVLLLNPKPSEATRQEKEWYMSRICHYFAALKTNITNYKID
ncbi:hypothetical protein Anapl_05789 [Anas platyrhynchos]|uniref:Uncharacterized protein n=1 Tax=Anas platyrhynchos TaxID=8839 RepID=R0LND0_ANAPL|nr:hypothetical protein Anapl_05789 [Anas platyrhynchos]